VVAKEYAKEIFGAIKEPVPEHWIEPMAEVEYPTVPVEKQVAGVLTAYGEEPEIETEPKKKKKEKKKKHEFSFDICDPSKASQHIVRVLSTTGDKEASADEVKNLLTLIMESCQVGAARGAAVVAKKKKTRPMNSWNCYLKTCAKTTPLSFFECMKDKERKEKEYFAKKSYWEELAAKGCPIEK